jgi:ribulose-5-phosphate 4-epimerase/fuculose-1-phosphate aldolase
MPLDFSSVCFPKFENGLLSAQELFRKSSDSAIHKARPDIRAAAHCHSIYGKAWSTFGKPVDIVTQDSCVFHDNLAVYENFGGVVLAKEEGENIARALGPKMKTCILQNHGLLTR